MEHGSLHISSLEMLESVRNYQCSAVCINLFTDKKTHDLLFIFSSSWTPLLKYIYSLAISEILNFFPFISSGKYFTLSHDNSQRNLFLTDEFHQWSQWKLYLCRCQQKGCLHDVKSVSPPSELQWMTVVTINTGVLY